jgi:uncharacterized protein YjbI with pentapeptide repeats
MENKKDLIKRWETTDAVLGKEIINAIKSSSSLDKIKGLQKINDRWDLRGLKFPNPKKIDKIKSYEKAEGAFMFKKVMLENVDLSYADLSYSEWQNCKVENAIFVDTKFRNVNIAATDFINTQIINSDLRQSFLGQNIGDNSGSFTHVDFIESDLSAAGFCFPKIENSRFENCNLKETDFDGSRLVGCKFKGLIDSSFFRGYSIHAHTSFLWVFNRAHVKSFLNPMYNVDFSDARLFGVSFTHGIDLKKCILPKDGSALLINNPGKTYGTIKEKINNEWSDEHKRIAIQYIDTIFYNKDRREQTTDIVDIDMLSEGKGMSEFGQKFFNLLKETSSDVPK